VTSSSSARGVALNGTAAGKLGVEPPIVVSPRTILILLHARFGTLEEVRESESGSEMVSVPVTTKECFPWEAEHSRSVDPMALENASLSSRQRLGPCSSYLRPGHSRPRES
jgi:hypothetical protein